MELAPFRALAPLALDDFQFAKRLVTFHYAPRYKGQRLELAREAQDAFLSG
ncbi:hypothetical protein [Methylocystis rosea]|uniref:hypothetical protein n=1 Tax=Methylocystis rosea TaxID=173366 RepID=UPI0012B35DD0|nr:hypothetical protein [Methylocystis rosea]